MNIADLVRSDVATMEPYTPIFPFDVLAARLGRAPDDIIKLDANENPYGPPPRVRAALANLPRPAEPRPADRSGRVDRASRRSAVGRGRSRRTD
jgi:histidinol-phosphate aminotransferase